MWQIIKLIQAFMGSMLEDKEDPFTNEGARVVTKDLPLQVYAVFYDAQGQFTPVLGWFYLKFKLIQAFMVVLGT